MTSRAKKPRIAGMPVRLIAMTTGVVALTGCASTYQPNGFTGGFSETQLDTNVFRVTFRGNGYTRADRAEDLALLRSADLTLKHGFTHFAIVDERHRENLGAVNLPQQSTTNFNMTASGNSAYGTARTTTTGGTFFVRRPSSTNVIMMFHGKPQGVGLIYDAKFVCGSLGPQYEVDCNKQ